MDDPTEKNLAKIRERLGAIYRPLLAAAAERVRADEASIWIRSPDQKDLVMVLNSGPDFASMELRVKQSLSEGIISSVYRVGRPVFENASFARQPHSPRVDISEGQSTHYIAAVPLLLDDRIVGVISAVQITTSSVELRDAKGWGLAANSLEVLHEISGLFTETLSASRLSSASDLTALTPTDTSLSEMENLSSNALTSARQQLGETFRSALASAATAILADEASFWMKAPDRDALVMILNGKPSAVHMELTAEQPLDDGLVSRVFRDGIPFKDPHSLPTRDHSKKIDIEFSQVTHYMAIVPVTVDGKRVGVVSAVKFPYDGDRIRRTSEWSFSKDALEVLGELAGKFAEALAP